ncbi:MAG: class I SAM-dependent methyltransferase [Ignavibacteria bacterium]|jgi:2-polyprenyl-3-methyl-5-hydroxy-6-metoxy-1,4-benzoquinol methylase|nr:class I SAM-dependent methyltransferase [Ignavibacteria bacterium]MDH7526850.1 class I SAM-dependent methyltransferase [Ignavibacteria bacterium]
MNCKICNSRRTTLFKTIGSFELLKCKDCQVIFLNNIEEILSAQNLYDEKYFENYLYEDEINLESVKSTAQYYLDYISDQFRIVNSILDVGAGFGLLVKAFRELGYNADGVEVSNYSVRVAKEKFEIELFNGDLQEFQTDQKYDLIAFYHSFEHLPAPLKTIRKVKSLLNTNGILWLSLPNVMSLDRFIQGENWNGWSLPYHFFHYSPRSIKNLLRSEGFEKIKIQKSFLSPFKLMRKNSSPLNINFQTSKYSRLKEFIRKPATLIFSGQNMNVFAQK